MGWKIVDNKLFPVTMLEQAGPDYILKYVRCGCGPLNCDSNRCSCKKHGLRCSMSCIKCNGVSCCNSMLPDESNSEVEDIEEVV